MRTACLQTVGAINWLAAKLSEVQEVPLKWAMLWLCVPVIALSAFVNNTPIVAALVPLVQVLLDVCARSY